MKFYEELLSGDGPVCDTMVLNLCSLYEIESSNSVAKKRVSSLSVSVSVSVSVSLSLLSVSLSLLIYLSLSSLFCQYVFFFFSSPSTVVTAQAVLELVISRVHDDFNADAFKLDTKPT